MLVSQHKHLRLFINICYTGGGFCTVLDEPFQGTTSCAGRANGDLGSSSGWPATATNGGKGVSTGGLLTDNKAQNPYMWDWSFAFFPYWLVVTRTCTAASATGPLTT